MLRVRPLSTVAFGALLLAMALGCSSVDQLPDPNPGSETLVVAYGDPALTPEPCDDVLPQIDGTATEQEWSSAEPLLVHMTGANGSGGGEYFLEVRAIWTDESRIGGTDRVYFLIRYPDNDQNNSPDLLGYVHPAGFEICDDPAVIGDTRYCPSPMPRISNVEIQGCDTLLIKNASWTRLNEHGREDQVVVLLTEVNASEDVSTLIDLNQVLLSKLGPQVPEDAEERNVGAPGTAPTDVWVWRAGRTNLHPVPQFADWSTVNQDAPVPATSYSRFTQTCGFFEDLWVEGGTVRSDQGVNPFLRNFGTTYPENGQTRLNEVTGEIMDTVPIFLTQCPPRGRDPSEEELAAQNGGLPKDLALWRHTASFFDRFGCDSLACSRTGAKPPKWSKTPLPQAPNTLENFDFVLGWALRVPFIQGQSPSGRDVRARGVYGASQEKGFGTWTIELMRQLNTQQNDDLVINPGTAGEYRMVIGVLDASGRVGSGSTEVRLKFQAPSTRPRTDSRC